MDMRLASIGQATARELASQGVPKPGTPLLPGAGEGDDARADELLLLRLVVERITVEDGQVRIETVIPTGNDDVQLRTRHPEPVEGRAKVCTAHGLATSKPSLVLRQAQHERDSRAGTLPAIRVPASAHLGLRQSELGASE